MSHVHIEVADDLAGILGELRQPIDKAALDLIVLGLYRRGKISSGRGAEILGLSRLDFIQHASSLGIPYLRLEERDLERELEAGRAL